MQKTQIQSLDGKIPWRKWQSTPVFLPGKTYGPRSLAGYSPWDRKELDMTEQRSQSQVNRDLGSMHSSKTPSYMLLL